MEELESASDFEEWVDASEDVVGLLDDIWKSEFGVRCRKSAT